MHGRLLRFVLFGAGCLMLAACPSKLRKASPPAQPPDALVAAYPDLAEALQEAKFVHSPVKEKRCMACHADITDIGKVNATEPDLCFGCHAALKSQTEAEGAHPPFSGGSCGGCHEVHNSEFPHLLSKEEKESCLQCHDLASRESRAAHAGISALEGCGECHAPHSASGAKLLWGFNLHMPFESKMCDSCHAVTEDGTVRLSGDGTEICIGCHADLGEKQELDNVHAPFSLGRCWTCHSAHRGRGRALLPGRAGALCAECHAGIPARGHPIMGHPAEDLDLKNPKDSNKPLDCAACHDPHASEFAKLIRAERKEICQWCHQK